MKTQPDLSGLSCRFEVIPAARGLILSVLVMPTEGADPRAFRKVIEDVIHLVERSPDAGRPVPSQGPPLTWPPQGLDEPDHNPFVDEAPKREEPTLEVHYLHRPIKSLCQGCCSRTSTPGQCRTCHFQINR